MQWELSSIREIREHIRNNELDEGDLRALSGDRRKGVQSLVASYRRRQAWIEMENHRLDIMLKYEREARRRGYAMIGGVDEAGRGPLAGPVVAGFVILPDDPSLAKIRYLDDSKKLTPQRREELFGEINGRALAVGIGIVDVDEIDELNIYNASILAMRKAVLDSLIRPDCILSDGVPIAIDRIPCFPIPGGDGKSLSIAAGSIVAKVIRDRIMVSLSDLYPQYGFDRNKGYGSAQHIRAIAQYGITPVHRKSFGPVAQHAHSESFRKFYGELTRARTFEALRKAEEAIRRNRDELDEEELSLLRREDRKARSKLKRKQEGGKDYV
ncbi:MAG: ribonuclease HII [bacterium]